MAAVSAAFLCTGSTPSARVWDLLAAADQRTAGRAARREGRGGERHKPPQPTNPRPGPPPARQRDPVQDQHNPTVLFNGMINPVIPYAIRDRKSTRLNS